MLFLDNIPSEDLENSKTNNIYLSFAVIDSGIGIYGKKEIDFYNEKRDIEEDIKTKGIGLNICKNLAKIMNIKIGFNTKLNQGTNYFILIPLNSKKNPNFLNYEKLKIWKSEKNSTKKTLLDCRIKLDYKFQMDKVNKKSRSNINLYKIDFIEKKNHR